MYHLKKFGLKSGCFVALVWEDYKSGRKKHNPFGVKNEIPSPIENSAPVL
ncbi:hypothetical protein CHISP_0442 [Chitinispirillum alkaliphilum]|nr:hypothetical protein CHISP_0442 [Chitinispirillum alkaliphilum]